MNDKPDTSKPSSKPDMIDILVICWGIIAIAFIAGLTWNRWIGKAAYMYTEITMFIFAWLYLRVRKLPQLELMRWRPVPRRIAGYLLLMAASGAVLLDELDRLVGLIIPTPEIQLEALQEAFVSSSPVENILIVLGVVVVAPLVEESLFRGIIQQTLERRWETTKAVLVTSLLFSLIHLQPWWMIQQLILAVLLGYLAWRWNSILPAVIIHAGNNLWALRNIAGLEDDAFSFYLWRGHVNPLLMIIALVLFMYGFKRCETIRESLVIRAIM